MSKYPIKNWKPADPVVRFKQKGKYLLTFITFNLMPGVTQTMSSRVDLQWVERKLRQGDISGLGMTYDEIEGIFGDIWKGIKKVGKGLGKGVKKIGKALGVKKIFKGLGKIGKLPGISAIPYVGPALKAVSVANDISTAITAKKKGRPDLAKKALRIAAKKTKKYGLNKKEVARQGMKIYQLTVAPQ